MDLGPPGEGNREGRPRQTSISSPTPLQGRSQTSPFMERKLGQVGRAAGEAGWGWLEPAERWGLEQPVLDTGWG